MSMELALLLGSFALLVLIDAPIAVALGLSSALYIAVSGLAPMMIVAQQMIAGIDSFTLLAIPLFLFAGLLMVHGGLAPRIVALFAAIVGQRTGGMAIVMIAACMMFGALSGSGVADVIAIGTMMLPAMRQNGYPPGFSAAALGCAGSLGTVIPPAIVLIVYGTATNTSIGKLFLGAIIPGILLGIGLMIVAWWISRKNGWKGGEPTSLRKVGHALIDAIPAMIAPLIIVGGIRFGVFTPTEAAAAGVLYALLVGGLFYRTLSFGKILNMLRETTETTGAILLAIASATVFGWILAAEQIPQMTVRMILGITENPLLVVALLMVVVLLLGTFMESLAIILILAPIFIPVLAAYQIDPVYFGVLLTINLAIGANSPPLGIDLMAACRTAGIPVSESFRYLSPFLGVMILVMFILVFFPGVITGVVGS
ncbi:TRAP transporter large permease [Sinirhodobacter populi]|uniref:TRAP transporter large permease protein n=1 Tax=Paenirhodobacter populi TaxID=2306993 RepID=A0A443K5B1_9RHOB|nr:TRAP transporter large permease [Sinirhodobacter populi]RWR27940.1 TRAP transporter large permease [Sinirhodobacter populi]RWR28342.1 TRAP transporter large permease [Sinirhodobacter populi]